MKAFVTFKSDNTETVSVIYIILRIGNLTHTLLFVPAVELLVPGGVWYFCALERGKLVFLFML